MQKFYTQTLESLFIQNLLSNTPLPLYDTRREGDFIIAGRYYVYKQHIIKCIKTGFLLNGNRPPLFPAENLFPNDDLYPSNGDMSAEWDEVCRYEFGKYYPKITYRFNPKKTYYDSETHKQLGRYLRCLRDLYDYDLMPFYNCYNAKNITDVVIGSKSVEKTNKVNLIAVPILYNQPYTININATSPVSMKAIKYGYRYMGDDITNRVVAGYDSQGNEEYYSYSINKIQQLGKPSKDKLINYGLYTQSTEEVLNEKFLYLCFQSRNIESISVIEGSYSQAEIKAMNLTSKSKFAEIPNMVSKLKLLDTHDDFYAFSDRLVEGLLGNIIYEQDPIYHNIGMLQEGLGQERTNIWDNSITIKLFNEYLASNNPYLDKHDITGRGDKSTEFFLLKGAN